MNDKEPLEESASALTAGQVRQKAVLGAMLIGTRGFVLKGLGLVANVVLARLLSPHEFGVVAIGTTAVMVGAYIADGGLGAGLIRQAEQPSAFLLRAFLGFQISVTCLTSLVVALGTLVAPDLAVITLVMVSSLPIVALRGPARILLERKLQYGPFVVAEIVEFIAYYLWAVGTVLLGWGVWGLATGFLVRSVIGTAYVLRAVPDSIMRPSLRWHGLRGVFGYGAKVFGVSAVALAKDQCVNVSIAAAGGAGLLGLWSASQRVMSVPVQVYRALFIVSLPAMSRLAEQEEQQAPLLNRTAVMTAHLSALLLVPVAACAPALVPVVFGEKWSAAASVFPAACAAVFLTSLSPVSSGYLAAVDRAGRLLWAAGMNGLTLLTLTAPLTLVWGLPGASMSWLLGALVEAVLVARCVEAASRARLLRAITPSGIAGVLSAGPAYVLCAHGRANISTLLLFGTLATLAYLVLLLLIEPRRALDTFRVLERRLPRRLSGRFVAVADGPA